MESNKPSEFDGEAIKEVLESLYSRINAERMKSDAYQKMFEASEHGIRGILSKAQHDISSILINVHTVFENLGMDRSKSRELWDALHLLPFLYKKARKDIGDNEGSCCEADKTREILNLWFVENFLPKK